MNIEKMKVACERLTWSEDEFDWDEPGRPRDEETRLYEPFLTTITWAEHIAEPIFEPLSKSAVNPDLKAVYAYFQEDERRHSRAELLIMQRWGLIKPGEMPTPSFSLRKMQELVQNNAHKFHPAVLMAFLPFFEIMLDGALIPHLSQKVTDPLFHKVFDKINADEGRHLTIGYHGMSEYGEASDLLDYMQVILSLRPDAHILYGVTFGLLPFLAECKVAFDNMGMDFNLNRKMLQKYIDLGESDEGIRKNRIYQFVRRYARYMLSGEFVVESYLAGLSDQVEMIDNGFSRLLATT